MQLSKTHQKNETEPTSELTGENKLHMPNASSLHLPLPQTFHPNPFKDRHHLHLKPVNSIQKKKGIPGKGIF